VKTKRIPGRNTKHKVLLYAISTCAWCKKTKEFLKINSIQYEYLDIDLCSDEDREEVRKDILNKGGRLSYPTVIVDDNVLITGFHEDKLQEALTS
jgi:glutaredoxin-like protein NrdH